MDAHTKALLINVGVAVVMVTIMYIVHRWTYHKKEKDDKDDDVPEW